jgi:hypothetical protein
MSSTLEDFDQLILKIMEEMGLDRSEYDHLHNISIMAIDILDSNPTYYNKIISDPELFSFLLYHIHKRMIKDFPAQKCSKNPLPSYIHILTREPSVTEDESR